MNIDVLILAVGAGFTFILGAIQALVAWHSTDPQLQKKLRSSIAVCVILAITLAGASYYQGTLPPSPSPPSYGSTPLSPIPNPSTAPAKTVPYNEDWSKGSDNWTTGDGWNITDGMLENDGSTKSSGIILAPFQPPSTNYSVEAHIQFLSSTDTNSKYGFGIIVRSSGAGDGYACYIIGPDYAYALITEVDPYYGPLTLNYGSKIPLKSYQYPPVNTNWHTYSVEVRGSQINFLIDNRLYPSAINGDYPSGTVVGLIDNYSIIHVSNFKVTTL